ncbi:MAG: hypothetical protein ABI742_05000 [Gemmatimonadota bacterium]
MSRSTPIVRLLPLLAFLVLLPSLAAAQTTGYAFFRTHATGAAFEDLGVYRTWVQGNNGLVETFSEEFTPGQHTVDRIDALVNNCRAQSTSPVTFTIKAGQWTEVDVPVTWRDCSYGINAYGNTVVSLAAGGVGFATCQVGFNQSGYAVWPFFHVCQGSAPYGGLVTVDVAPFGTFCCSFQDSFTIDTSIGTGHPYGFPYGTSDTSGSVYPDPSAVTDLSITLVGGSFGGQVASSVFRVVNHGSNNAWTVQVRVEGDSADDFNNNWTTTTSIADGHCNAVVCNLAVLPAGDSTTVTVRYDGAPNVLGDTTLANFPTLTPSCYQVTVSSQGNPNAGDPSQPDPDLSNNTAHCIWGVPVNVTLGGSTPPNQTVASGSTDVPMLEFLLNPSIPQTVNSVTLQAQGSGNEILDVTAVHLYLDANGNGQVDPAETLLASGIFPSNNGSVTLAVAPPYAISGPTNLLVTYSFNITIVQRLGGGVALAMLPLFFFPVMRRRKGLAAGALVLLLGVGLASCGGSDSIGPGATSRTYQVKLTGLNLSGSDQSGVSLTGATVTVTK